MHSLNGVEKRNRNYTSKKGEKIFMKIITDVVDIKLEKDEVEKIKDVQRLLQSIIEELSKVSSRNTHIEICNLANCINLLKSIIKQYDTTSKEQYNLIGIEKETPKSLVELLFEPILEDINEGKEIEKTSEEEHESVTFSMDIPPKTDEELLNTFGNAEWLEEFKKWMKESNMDSYCIRSSYDYHKIGDIDSNIRIYISNIGTKEIPNYMFTVKWYSCGIVVAQLSYETIISTLYKYKSYLFEFCSNSYKCICANGQRPQSIEEQIGYYLLNPKNFETFEKKENCIENEETVKEMVKYLRVEEE